MAPTHAVVPVVAVASVGSAAPDRTLARRAAALITRFEPHRDPRQVVESLLSELRQERLVREARGLNHWAEHAPQFLAQLVRRRFQEQRLRRDRVAAFRRDNHAVVLAFAYAALKDRDEAEDEAERTYVEYLEGRTDDRHFMRALKSNVIDRQKRRGWESRRFEPVEVVFNPRHTAGEDVMSGGESEEFSLEPASPCQEDRDPLDILIAREEAEERARLLDAARRDPRWRYVKRRAWAVSLGADVRN
jgi:hypothetical protein